MVIAVEAGFGDHNAMSETGCRRDVDRLRECTSVVRIPGRCTVISRCGQGVKAAVAVQAGGSNANSEFGGRGDGDPLRENAGVVPV